MDNCDYFVSQTAPEQYLLDRNKELTARIAELERREAMLVNAAKDLREQVLNYCRTGNLIFYTGDVREALSATSADTEAWLQAEIVKRLGEPKAWYDQKNDAVYTEDDHITDYDKKVFESLYRLPYPLATPQGRQDLK